MITLYTWATPNGRKISIALEELGLEYRVSPVNIMREEQFKPDFLALNPNNKIPVIVDDDAVGGHTLTLFESGAILYYLAEKTGRLLGDDIPSRYQALQWLMFQVGGVGPTFGQTHHFKRYASTEIYGLNRFTSETHRLYRVLDGRLAQSPYIAGIEYTIADIATFPWVSRFELHSLEWAEVPHVKRWFDMVSARPAVVRGMSVPTV